MEKLLERGGHVLHLLEILLGLDVSLCRLFCDGFNLRLSLLPEMELIAPDTHALRKAPSFCPVHMDAGILQRQGAVPERQGIAQIHKIELPVFLFLFQCFHIDDGLAPLSQIDVEFFQRFSLSRPRDDVFLLLRRVLIELFLERCLLVVDHLHAVHELVPLLLTIRREHLHLRGEIQLVLDITRPLVVFPGAQPLRELSVPFLVLGERSLELTDLLFQKLLLLLQLGEILFLMRKMIQLLIHRIQIRHQLINLTLSLRRSHEELFLILLDILLGTGELITALQHEETAADGVIRKEGSPLQVL